MVFAAVFLDDRFPVTTKAGEKARHAYFHKFKRPQLCGSRLQWIKALAVVLCLSQGACSVRDMAERGDMAAQNHLGVMYANGEGVSQDYAEAAKWFRKSADQGGRVARYNLGHMYELGLGVPQNDTEAANWYSLAADQGVASAQNDLGLMYLYGRGVAQDDTKAMELFLSAAKLAKSRNLIRLKTDDPLPAAVPQNNVGFMYQKGRGVVQSNTEAVKWYRMAAEQGYALAQRNLALMYLDGLGVAQDNEKATEWLTKAAHQGDTGAIRQLKQLQLEKLQDTQQK